MLGMSLFKCASNILGKAHSFPVFNFYAVHETQMFYYLLCKEGGFSPPPIRHTDPYLH